MRKKAMLFLAAVLLLSAACSSSEKRDSTACAAYSQEMLFEDVQSLNEYLNHNKNGPSKNKRAGAASEEIPVFEVSIDLEEAKLWDLRLSGNNAYYRYVLNGFQYGSFPEAPEGSEEQPCQEEAADKVSSAASSPTPDGETDSNIYDEEFKHTISVGWNYTGNGESGLQYFVESNPDNVFRVDGFEGLYYSNSGEGKGDVVAKMLYWVQDDCFFSAAVPIDYVDYMIERIYADEPLAKKYRKHFSR